MASIGSYSASIESLDPAARGALVGAFVQELDAQFRLAFPVPFVCAGEEKKGAKEPFAYELTAGKGRLGTAFVRIRAWDAALSGLTVCAGRFSLANQLTPAVPVAGAGLGGLAALIVLLGGLWDGQRLREAGFAAGLSAVGVGVAAAFALGVLLLPLQLLLALRVRPSPERCVEDAWSRTAGRYGLPPLKLRPAGLAKLWSGLGASTAGLVACVWIIRASQGGLAMGLASFGAVLTGFATTAMLVWLLVEMNEDVPEL